GLLSEDVGEPGAPRARSHPCGPGRPGGPDVCGNVWAAARRRLPRGTDGCRAHYRAAGARVPRPVPQRVRPDRGRAVLDPASPQGAHLDAARLVRGEPCARAVELQPGDLCEAPGGTRPLEGVLPEAPVARTRDEGRAGGR